MTQDENLGEWLNRRYPEKDMFRNAIRRIVMPGALDDMPSVVSIVPREKVNELFVGLDQLDYSKDAKHGFPGFHQEHFWSNPKPKIC